MSAYFIVDVEIHDMPGMVKYRQQVPGIMAKYGGRYVVRGGKFETLEGTWHPKRLSLVEFPQLRAGQAMVRLRRVSPFQSNAAESGEDQRGPA